MPQRAAPGRRVRRWPSAGERRRRSRPAGRRCRPRRRTAPTSTAGTASDLGAPAELTPRIRPIRVSTRWIAARVDPGDAEAALGGPVVAQQRLGGRRIARSATPGTSAAGPSWRRAGRAARAPAPIRAAACGRQPRGHGSLEPGTGTGRRLAGRQLLELAGLSQLGGRGVAVAQDGHRVVELAGEHGRPAVRRHRRQLRRSAAVVRARRRCSSGVALGDTSGAEASSAAGSPLQRDQQAPDRRERGQASQLTRSLVMG